MSKIFKFLLFILAITISCAYTHYSTKPNRTTVTLINNSSHIISTVTLSVDKSFLAIDNMARKSTATATLAYKGETHYNISVHFADNSTLEKQVGYLMSPIDMTETIYITDTDATL